MPINKLTAPRKRVHFPSSLVTQAYTYGELDDIPRTPSPSWSDESLSEAGPSTPPSRTLAGLTLRDEKLIPATHPFLSINPYTRTAPLCWDISLSPTFATVRSSTKGKGKAPAPNGPLGADELDKPATHPPTKHMEVHIPHFPWKTQVNASDSRVVTTSDLLSDIYNSLQTNVREEEFNRFSPAHQAAITAAFYARCQRVARAHLERARGRKADTFNREDEAECLRRADAEKVKGLRRVDCLGGLTEFTQLMSTPPPAPHNAWLLHLASQRP